MLGAMPFWQMPPTCRIYECQLSRSHLDFSVGKLIYTPKLCWGFGAVIHSGAQKAFTTGQDRPIKRN